MKRDFYRSEKQTFESSHLPARDTVTVNFEYWVKTKRNLELKGDSLYQVIASFRN
jgi:hypothetical protein